MKINIPVDELIVIVAMHGFFCKKVQRKNTKVTLIIENDLTYFDEKIIISDDIVQYVCKIDTYCWSLWSKDNVKEFTPPSLNELSDLKFISNYVDE